MVDLAAFREIRATKVRAHFAASYVDEGLSTVAHQTSGADQEAA